MKLKSNRFVINALTLALVAQLILPCAAGSAKGPAQAPAPVPQEPQVQDPRRCAEGRDRDPERCIKEREAGHNGIIVGEPRVYDDALLQQMLRAAESRLAAIQVFDQAAILSRLGAVTGASQQFSSFGLNVQGAPVPGVTTATTLPTLQTTTATAAGATSSGVTTVSGLGTENVTTTQPVFTPPTAPAPPPTQNFPTGFSVSASDILNEQTQLSAEINGLRLLLSGSLSDHYVRNQQVIDDRPVGNAMTKFKTTLGFPITVTPNRQYKDAVAIVEVEAEELASTSFPREESPTITTIIPREKTYNVAAITDRSTSIGGGVATQILGFSGSWVRGHKTYYLVQDQDTVALTYRPADGRKVGFLWQFRPVLGQRFVKTGLKQTYVQLAFSTRPGQHANQVGKVSVRTYWRKYDRKAGVVGDIIRGSYREMYRDIFIPKYELVVNPSAFRADRDLEDLGGGQLLLRVPGRFLPGTTVRIGSSLMAPGPRFRLDYQGMEFVASTSDLANKNIVIVGHDGTEVPLRFHTQNCAGLSMGTPQVSTVDETNSRVRVLVRPSVMAREDATPRLVFIVGGRVFGYSDAPVKREVVNPGAANEEIYLSAVMPTALLLANPELKVRALITDGCSATTSLADQSIARQKVRLVLLEQDGKNVQFLAFGDLRNLTVLSPAPTAWRPIDPSSDGSPYILSLNAGQVTANKFVVFKRRDEEAFLVAMPELAPAQPTPPKARDTLTVNEDEAVIVGDGLRDVASITYKDQEVKFALENEGKSLRMSGLRALGATSSAAKKTFVLKFKSPDAKPKEVEFEVFDKRQEITTPKS
jgi:hypothetical protein